MNSLASDLPAADAADTPAVSRSVELATHERTRLVGEHFDYVWRLLRRLGLSPSDADDAAQEVFMVGLAKWRSIEVGRERAFFYGCALNKARHVRSERNRTARHEMDTEALACPLPSLDDLIDQKKAALLLDRVLDTLNDDQRRIFVLFEIEQLTLSEAAELLQIPTGTAASRLRLARERVRNQVASWHGLTLGVDVEPLSPLRGTP